MMSHTLLKPDQFSALKNAAQKASTQTCKPIKDDSCPPTCTPVELCPGDVCPYRGQPIEFSFAVSPGSSDGFFWNPKLIQ